MFVLSIFVAILMTVIANSEAKIVPINTNGSEIEYDSQVRIVGGKPAGIEISQYQVGLYFIPFEDAEEGSWCGGTLISEQYVLTAAHCFFDCDNQYKLFHSATVHLGARNPDNEVEEGQERHNVTNKNFIKHSDYDHVKTINDIALIKLPKPIKFNKYIKAASLPRRSTHTKEFLLGKTILSSGWGGTNELKDMSEHLMFIKTIIQRGEVCNRKFQQKYNDDRMICINAKGKSTCDGDSGGPQIYKENGVNYVVGVIAFATNSCVIGAPQVGTRVTYYLDWIAEKTKLPV